MVAAEHRAGVKCTYPVCGKLAGFAIRPTGGRKWAYSCGNHVGMLTREAAWHSGGGVQTDVLGEPA